MENIFSSAVIETGILIFTGSALPLFIVCLKKEVTTIDKPMSSPGFKLMSLMFKVRDFFRPRLDLLKEAGIEAGFCILEKGQENLQFLKSEFTCSWGEVNQRFSGGKQK